MPNLKAKKSLGQNFLQDQNILTKIANAASPKEEDLIIEIGPGLGALTTHLQAKNSYLICYEIDKRMKPYLDPLINPKTNIIYEDFLTTDLSLIPSKRTFIIANIPYYITTKIIKKALTITNLESMTILVQKEVAKRFCATPGSKDYGSITVYLNYYFDITYLFDVKNTCFKPIPKVDSAVITFTKKKTKIKVKNEELLFKLITDAFKMKRKTLKNNLTNYNWPKISQVLAKYNFTDNVRAEQLDLTVFIAIANFLEE